MQQASHRKPHAIARTSLRRRRAREPALHWTQAQESFRSPRPAACAWSTHLCPRLGTKAGTNRSGPASPRSRPRDARSGAPPAPTGRRGPGAMRAGGHCSIDPAPCREAGGRARRERACGRALERDCAVRGSWVSCGTRSRRRDPFGREAYRERPGRAQAVRRERAFGPAHPGLDSAPGFVHCFPRLRSCLDVLPTFMSARETSGGICLKATSGIVDAATVAGRSRRVSGGNQ